MSKYVPKGRWHWEDIPHPGYLIADLSGTVLLLPEIIRDYDVAEREAGAHNGIVVRADWPGITGILDIDPVDS